MGFLIFLTLAVFAQQVHSSNILALMTVSSHSHHFWNLNYLEALTARGHQITYLGVDDYKKPAPNISYILIENSYSTDEDVNYTDVSDMRPFDTIPALYGWYTTRAADNAKQEGFKKFLNVIKSEKFDLVVFDLGTTTFLLGAVDIIGRPPVIGITPFAVPPWAMDLAGTPYPIQNGPHFLVPLGKEMNFCDRLYNAFIFYYSKYYHCKYTNDQNEIAKVAFGPNIRSIAEIQEDITINMVNMNWATELPFPITPSLIPVGGLHIKPVQPLPSDLKQFLDSATDGVIYFSLGSNIQSTFLQKREIEILTEAFKKLAPIQVLWKWENDTIPGKPDNVRIRKWLPQNDILAHPNVRLFFTHGGLLSSQEAVFHGVPIVGMPIFLDQHVNIEKAVKAGYGEILILKHISPETVVAAINKVLSNPHYRENAQTISKIFQDRTISPLDNAVYWTEYAIRHNGAHHFRPVSKRLNWFQNQLYDILLFVISITFISVYIIILVLKRIARLVCEQKQKPKQH